MLVVSDRVTIKFRYLFSILFFFIVGVNSKFTGIDNIEFYQKIFTLFIAVFCLFFSRKDVNVSILYAAFLFNVIICFLLSEYASKDFFLTFYTTISMSIFFLICIIKIGDYLVVELMHGLILLPFTIVIAAIALSFVQEYPLFIAEFTGVQRLSAGLDPAHLGIIILYSLIAAIVLSHYYGKPLLYTVSLLYVLLLLTGSRGALIASLFCSLTLLKFYKQRYFLNFMKIFFLPIAIVFIFFTRSIIQRTFDLESDGLNLSGRDYAWAFLIESFDNVNYFGRGLGSITEALIYETSNNLSAFVAPHNEYIRFWYDLGYFGAVIFFFIIIKIINNSFKSSPTNLLIVKWPLLITVCFFCFVDNVFSTHHSYLPLALILVFFMNIESNKNV